MSKRHLYTIVTLLLASIAANSSFAQTLNAENLITEAYSYLTMELSTYEAKGFRTEYKIGKVSPKFSVPVCESEIKKELRRDIFKTANNTIAMSCASPTWQIHISAKAALYKKVITALQSIPKNTAIRESHLGTMEQQVNLNRRGSYGHPDHLVGMITKRSIRQGEVISPTQLKAPMLVQRGDEVLISASNSAIRIQMKGEALSAGSLGEQISVRNLSSERIIRAQVLERGKVLVVL
ncbi:hypothetical protein A3715_06335 [Oleiphilus sp. HI0009]|uniref:flagellar basal body P-ring formation chaperone FlgA n=1 Tax=unclassified Oleiphilus TaxID=2631174 RepID=UPI0007C32029|nr:MULTISPECIES: flagellar basal body P-ring formation chaperone FlgA [unclassified Oleiphilus]KZX82131.1 hypothetical protein A3715_06335 [Oleiphilus sp. HI0009]MCH2157865.1 flagellar basal body P-ring formation protein FlgA [Oleiphilaceae bacterium]KZY66375.1 hypothetical protein A3738_06755 [Oleiphilus sp. HI0066]KZY71281.1 hypothetical protein A3739_05495 [Oleiphilus sp. HI0067]KZZ58746.1 hypothetical protein A3762_07070 [Oleiphilus sp. HI0125]